MTSRVGPILFLLALFGSAVSVGAGTALGNYAAGGIDSFYGHRQLASLDPAPPRQRLAVADADLAEQWPVGTVHEEEWLSGRR